MRPFHHSAALWFLGLWLALMIVGRHGLFQDPGVFWHTALGEQMLDSGELIRVDTLTATFAGRPWIDQQWLPDLAMALLYRAGGWDLLLTAAAMLLAGLFACLTATFCRRGLHPLAAAVVLTLLLAACSHHFHVRPHLTSMVLLAATFALLGAAERREAARRAAARRAAEGDADQPSDDPLGAARAQLDRRLWLLPPLFMVWANCHGGVLAGYGTFALVAAGWLLQGWRRRCGPAATGAARGELLLLAVAVAATPWINPYGAELPQAWLQILSMPLPRLIQEHRPLEGNSVEGVAVLLLGVLYLGMLADAWRTQRRVTWLLPLVWLALAWSRVRNAPLLAVVAGLTLADMLPFTQLAVWLQRRELFEPSPAGDESRRSEIAFNDAPRLQRWPRLAHLPWAIGALLLAASVGLQVSRTPVPVVGAGWAGPSPARWPYDTLTEMRRLERESPPATPIFNALDYGGFVNFYTPGLKTFIDDRCELFGPEFLFEYAAAESQRPAQLEAWDRRYRFAAALVQTGSGFDRHLAQSPHWQTMSRSPRATLYRRDRETSPSDQLPPALLNMTRHGGPPPEQRRHPGPGEPLAHPAHDSSGHELRWRPIALPPSDAELRAP